MKARIERERIPPREDPQFHLKLGRGSLSDVEWTVQLLQLRHGVAAHGHHGRSRRPRADTELLDRGRRQRLCATPTGSASTPATAGIWSARCPAVPSPGDALPTEPHQLSRLARSLGTTPAALRDEYRRVTRRARRVVERLFYGIDGRPPEGAAGLG